MAECDYENTVVRQAQDLSTMNISDDDSPTLLAAFWIVRALCFAVGLFGLSIVYFMFNWSGYEKPSAEATFTELTTWNLDASNTIEDYAYSYSEWPGDGDARVVADLGVATLKALMSKPGFEWQAWPPADDFLMQVRGLPAFRATHFRTVHIDSKDDWHRGTIVMVNTESGKVCAYSWKD